MSILIRYDTKDEKGETRRERNIRFNDGFSPSVIVPAAYRYLWDWYFEIRNAVRDVIEERANPIPPSEYKAWVDITDNEIKPWHVNVFIAMDRAYCLELNKELTDYRLRREEERRTELEQIKNRQGR